MRESDMPDDASSSTHVRLRLPSEVVGMLDRLAALLERPRSWLIIRGATT